MAAAALLALLSAMDLAAGMVLAATSTAAVAAVLAVLVAQPPMEAPPVGAVAQAVALKMVLAVAALVVLPTSFKDRDPGAQFHLQILFWRHLQVAVGEIVVALESREQALVRVAAEAQAIPAVPVVLAAAVAAHFSMAVMAVLWAAAVAVLKAALPLWLAVELVVALRLEQLRADLLLFGFSIKRVMS